MPATGPGVIGPRTGTPARRPASWRRTTTHTSRRPDGILGDVQMEAAGRDAWTAPDGAVAVLDQRRVEATIAYVRDRSLTAVRLDPPDGRFGALVGLPVSSGFRRAVDAAWGSSERDGALLYQLLDELPTAALVSGFALGAAGVHPPPGSFDLRTKADICAGWVTGGTILVEGEKLGHTPSLAGPPAPALLGTDDAQAWHPVGPIGPHGMRRWRQIDVWRPEGGDVVAVEAFFRDSHVDGEGSETVVHEYVVTAELDPGTLRFLACRAEAGALPWTECPGALASAGRLVGSSPDGLRPRVRESFVGTSTCTHLNDTLRALGALPPMVAAVVRGGPGAPG